MADFSESLVSGRKRIANLQTYEGSPAKQARLSKLHPAKLNVETESSLSSSSESEEDSDAESKQTPSTPLSNKSWPSLRKTIKCTFLGCDKKFNRQAKLRDHLHYHTGERPFVCTHTGCCSSFPRKAHLDRHVKSAHTNIRDYTCSYDGCGKAFSTGTRLKRHEASHEKRSQFRCDECSQEFRKHVTLQKHIDTDHLGLKAFTCDTVLEDGALCGMGFDRATGLNSHKARIHGMPKYECEICRSSLSRNQENSSQAPYFHFLTYSELQNHNRLEHPLTCTHCEAACSTRKELSRHMELQHGILPAPEEHVTRKSLFMCTENGCGRSFTRHGNLKVHIQSVHVQSRPYVCGSANLTMLNGVNGWTGEGACHRDFKAKSHLEEHIRTVHMGLESRHKARKQSNQKKGAPVERSLCMDRREDTIAQLTGTFYREKASRKINCLITGCPFLVTREYDLDVHLRSRHGLDDDDIQVARASRWYVQGNTKNGSETGGHGSCNRDKNLFENGLFEQHMDHAEDDQIGHAEQDAALWVNDTHAEFEQLGDSYNLGAPLKEMETLTRKSHVRDDSHLIDPSLL